MSDIKPPAQPQRTQSAEEFAKHTPEYWGLAVYQGRDRAKDSNDEARRWFNFAEAYAQSLKEK